MDTLYVIGRMLFAMIFIGSGLGHFAQIGPMSQYAGSKSVPASKLAVMATGLMILAGGLSVLLGIWMEIGTWLLVLFLVPTAFIMHNFWAVADPAMKQVEQAQFMKNLSMAGAALILYWMVTTYGYGPLTLGQPL
ncbi:MAG: DoxX family protein [Gemmatimonadota bacterium]